jgi:hypothetical protein
MLRLGLLASVLLSVSIGLTDERPSAAGDAPSAAEVARQGAQVGAQGDPAIVSWGGGRVDVFVRGGDNALWQKSYANGTWTNWTSLGGQLASSPAASSWGANRLDVFARDIQGALIHTWYAGGWSGRWESLGGALSSDPAAVSWSSGRIDVFGRGTDNALYHIYFEGSWSGWERLGGAMASGPAVSTWGANRLDIFARGTDNSLQHLWFDGRWSSWEKLPGTLDSDPAAASTAVNRIDVFFRNNYRIVQQVTWSGSWSLQTLAGSVGAGSAVSSGPDATVSGYGQLDLVVRGDDNLVYSRRFSNATWSAWTSQGVPGMTAAAAPTPIATVSATPYEGAVSGSGLNLSLQFTDVALDKTDVNGAVSMRGPASGATIGSRMITVSHGLPAGDYRFQVDFVKVAPAANVVLNSGMTTLTCNLTGLVAQETCTLTTHFNGGGSNLDFQLFVQSGQKLIPVKVYLHRLQ